MSSLARLLIVDDDRRFAHELVVDGKKFPGSLVLMSGGFELYLKMAGDIAHAHGLKVVAQLPKPFPPKQFSYLLISLIWAAIKAAKCGHARNVSAFTPRLRTDGDVSRRSAPDGIVSSSQSRSQGERLLRDQ